MFKNSVRRSHSPPEYHSYTNVPDVTRDLARSDCRQVLHATSRGHTAKHDLQSILLAPLPCEHRLSSPSDTRSSLQQCLRRSARCTGVVLQPRYAAHELEAYVFPTTGHLSLQRLRRNARDLIEWKEYLVEHMTNVSRRRPHAPFVSHNRRGN